MNTFVKSTRTTRSSRRTGPIWRQKPALVALLATFTILSHAEPPADLTAGDLRRSGTIELAITCHPEVR